MSFYSLTCETYSATCSGSTDSELASRGFYSLSCETYSATPSPSYGGFTRLMFLFAVVRDVQRNGPRRRLCRGRPSFYSLSCETYSATTGGFDREAADELLSIRCRARRTAQQAVARGLNRRAVS